MSTKIPHGDLRVSIALCTYNGGEFLIAQLATLAAQTVTPFEVVVGDDCSTDNTVQIVENFAATAPFPVRLFRNPVQLGYRRNFMQVARRCSGDVIAFCDQDDLWLPAKLETCLAAFVDPGVVLVVHDAMIADADGRPRGDTLYRDRDLQAVNGNPDAAPDPWPFFLGLTQVFRPVLIEDDRCDAIADHENGDRLAHDQIVPFVALEHGRTHFLPEPLVLYRQHGRNVFGVKRTRLFERLRKRLRLLLTNRSIEYRNHASAAQDRCRFLRRPSKPDGLAGPFASPAVAERYSELCRLFQLRERLYAEPGLSDRVRALIGLLRMGAYSGADRWHLSPKTAIRDALLGMLLQPLLRPMVGAGPIDAPRRSS